MDTNSNIKKVFNQMIMPIFIQKFIRDFLRKRTYFEIQKTVQTQEPVLSIWVFGYLAFRKKYSFVMNQWVDLGQDEAIGI